MDKRTKAMRRSVDRHVGANLRRLRQEKSLTQQLLAARMAISYQQLQKYEQGTNRIAASTLYELSWILDVPITAFFDGLDSAK